MYKQSLLILVAAGLISIAAPFAAAQDAHRVASRTPAIPAHAGQQCAATVRLIPPSAPRN